MTGLRGGRDVMVAGVGLHPFGRFDDEDLSSLAQAAVVEALEDAGVRWRDIPIAYFGHVYYHGMSVGETVLSKLGMTAADSPDRYIGGDHMMAGYALRMRRYMEETGAPLASLAQVAVKASDSAALNPYAHRKQTFTLDAVLESRPIAEPLTLYQCCPTSEGAAAAVLRSGTYNGRGSDHSAFSPNRTEPAAIDAYEMSGLGPEDIDLVQVHDAATIGELQQLEALQLLPRGEAWRATLDGRTALSGDLPTNTDGGLLAMGHPFGATGIRMIHETVTQLRGEAGPRQVADARVGLAQCSGAGDVTTVHILVH